MAQLHDHLGSRRGCVRIMGGHLTCQEDFGIRPRRPSMTRTGHSTCAMRNDPRSHHLRGVVTVDADVAPVDLDADKGS
jgi:hypothetical protein